MWRAVTISHRLACVSTLFALAVLSLLPAGSVHRTEIGGHGEHLLAYAGTAFLLGIGARPRNQPLLLLTLIAYAGLLEVLQLLSPGRKSQIGDFIYSAAGVFLGIIVAGVLQAGLRRWTGHGA